MPKDFNTEKFIKENYSPIRELLAPVFCDNLTEQDLSQCEEEERVDSEDAWQPEIDSGKYDDERDCADYCIKTFL